MSEEDKPKVVVKSIKPEDFMKMIAEGGVHDRHSHDDSMTVRAEDAIKSITANNYVNLGVNLRGEMIFNIQFPVAELGKVLYSIERLLEKLTIGQDEYEPEEAAQKKPDQMYG